MPCWVAMRRTGWPSKDKLGELGGRPEPRPSSLRRVQNVRRPLEAGRRSRAGSTTGRQSTERSVTANRGEITGGGHSPPGTRQANAVGMGGIGGAREHPEVTRLHLVRRCWLVARSRRPLSRKLVSSPGRFGRAGAWALDPGRGLRRSHGGRPRTWELLGVTGAPDVSCSD